MIGPGNGVRVFLAVGTTNMRCGIASLCARAKKSLGEDPASGAVFVFRGRMGDRLKILHWDGQGSCLYYKVLERGYSLQYGSCVFYGYTLARRRQMRKR